MLLSRSLEDFDLAINILENRGMSKNQILEYTREIFMGSEYRLHVWGEQVGRGFGCYRNDLIIYGTNEYLVLKEDDGGNLHVHPLVSNAINYTEPIVIPYGIAYFKLYSIRGEYDYQ